MDARISQQSRNRFDDLPEELVTRIFSFLPTRSAVKASVVCKSWKDRWMSLPNLSFKEHAPETWPSVPDLSTMEIECLYGGYYSIEEQSKRDLFLEFVNRVICCRKPCKINEFSLNLDVRSDSDLISTWLDCAVDRDVEVFYLRLFCDMVLDPLPASLFNCKSLTEMHLEIDGILELPTASVHFPSLKILRLVGVWFAGDKLTISGLFSNCPLLEELHLIECSFTDLENVHISAPRLTSLSIIEVDDSSNFPEECQVSIHGTNLKRFIYQGQFMNITSSLLHLCKKPASEYNFYMM